MSAPNNSSRELTRLRLESALRRGKITGWTCLHRAPRPMRWIVTESNGTYHEVDSHGAECLAARLSPRTRLPVV